MKKWDVLGVIFCCFVGAMVYEGFQSTTHHLTGSFESACPSGMVKEGYDLSNTGQSTIQCATKGWNAFHRFGFQGVMVSLIIIMIIGFTGLFLLSKPIMNRRVQAALWKKSN